jgi:uroporphyrinogen-III synthase
MSEFEPAPRVLVTREDPGPLVEAIALAGGDPIVLPLLATRWLDFELPDGRTPDDYDWVAFTSVRGLLALARAADRRGWSWPPAARAAAVGDRTGHELQALGWMPECVAEDSSARGLVEALRSQDLLGARVLFPASALAEPTLPEGLRRAGAVVDVVPVYTTEASWTGSPEMLALLGRDLASALAHGCIATCASPSAARALVDLAFAAGTLEQLRATPVVVLGPTTARAVTALGLRPVLAGGASLSCLARKAVEIGARPS